MLALPCLLVATWIVSLAGSILWFSSQTDAHPADAAIVLGAAITNSSPSPVFEQRLRHAISLYQRGAVQTLILTGGVGVGQTLAESEVARTYCLTHEISANAMLIEIRSRSTEENLIEARRLLVGSKLNRVLIVSDPLHERRALTIARDLGLNAYPSPTPTSRYVGFLSRTQFLVRETYFYARYLLARTLRSR